MNYLGHAYLSYQHPHLLVGNMISDFMKGRAVLGLNGKIQGGIYWHRAIDRFTDDHPATKKAKEFFRPAYRLYSAPIVDVLYDHYLARTFEEEDLKAFTLNTYRILEEQVAHLPSAFLPVFAFMKKDNWLYNYREKEGMRKSLNGLVRRSKYMTDSTTAYNLFLTHYVELEECFSEFFVDVKQFAKQELPSYLV